jgi:hypothetical protein
MGSDPSSCAICDWPPSGVTMRNSGEFHGLLIECPRCGRYELVGDKAIAQSFQWTPELKNALSCAARQASEADRPIRIAGANAEELAQPHMNTRVSDNQERLLREIARRARRPQRGAGFSPPKDFTLIDCYSEEEFLWHIESLESQQLVFRTGAGPETVELTLSMEGWKQVQPPPRTGGFPGQCFVAMWLSEDTRAAYEGGIEPAISRAGFKPIRIDLKEHNNEITDEIMAEIRNSEFIVADFTGQRAGVYYEAGFAMGLGRKVIWCCRKDEISKLHFDTNHKNHIDWQTPEELGDRLYARIRATILEQG